MRKIVKYLSFIVYITCVSYITLEIMHAFYLIGPPYSNMTYGTIDRLLDGLVFGGFFTFPFFIGVGHFVYFYTIGDGNKKGKINKRNAFPYIIMILFGLCTTLGAFAMIYG